MDAQFNAAMRRGAAGGATGGLARSSSQTTAALKGTAAEIANVNKLAATGDAAVKKLAERYLDLKRVVETGLFVSPAAEKTKLNQLANVITDLSQRGTTLSQSMANVRNRIREIDQTASASKGIAKLNQEFLRLDASLRKQAEGAGMRRGDLEKVIGITGSIGAMGGVAAGGDPRATRMLNVYKDALNKLGPALDAATVKQQKFVAAMKANVLRAETFNLPAVGPTQLGQGLAASLALANKGFVEGAEGAEFFAQRIEKLPPSFDRATASFIHHAGRIASGILIYDAFGTAVQGVSDEIKTIGDLARETIRFEAVVGDLGTAEQGRFIEELGNISVTTNTEITDLVSSMDSVAFGTQTLGNTAKSTADALDFMNLAGQFTNITQRSLADETQRLLGIMNLADDSIEQFGDRLGRITTMGGNNAAAIGAITDVLAETGRAAQATGFDLDLLGGIGVEIFRKLQGSMSGAEIGSQLNTILGRLQDPDVRDEIESITQGIIKFTDQAGNVRNLSDVFLELTVAISENALNAEQTAAVFDQIIPPLNPGAASFVRTLQSVMPDALRTVASAANSTSETVKDLSDKLVSGPAEQFATAMKDIGNAMRQIFTSDVVGGFKSLATIFSVIATGLKNEVIGGLIGATAKIIAMVAAVRLLAFAWKTLGTLLFSGIGRAKALDAAVASMGTSFSTGATQVGAYGGKLNTVSTTAVAATGKIGTLTRAVGGLAKMLAAPLVLVLAFEIAEDLPDIINSIKEKISPMLTSELFTPEELAFGNQTRGIQNIHTTLAQGERQEQLGFSEIDIKNIQAFIGAQEQLREQGKLNVETQKALDDAFRGSDGARKEEIVTIEQAIAAVNDSIIATELETGAMSRQEAQARRAILAHKELTFEETVAAGTKTNLAFLTDNVSAAYENLAERLRDGSISQQEYAQGTAQVTEVSQLAAQAVAANGFEIGRLPQFMAAATEGQEGLTKAVFEWILASGNALPAIKTQIAHILALGAAVAAAAAKARENPIIITIATRSIRERGQEGGLEELRNRNREPFLAPDIRSLSDQITDSIADLFQNAGIIGAGNNFTGAGGGGGGGAASPPAPKQKPQTSIVDIGDLDASSISKIVAIAIAAQKKVQAAGGTVDTDETIAIFKDAIFRRFLTGVDQRFLSEAIQELTDVERERLEAEEKRLEAEKLRLEEERRRNAANELLQNLHVRAGPLGALISQPVLFGVGGSIPAGLNADPQRGNFTVNVPIALSGLAPAKLQQMIFEAVSRAIRDGLRLSGNI